jgi:3,4-dihydroxy-2-butanone 4-phosphate synthase
VLDGRHDCGDLVAAAELTSAATVNAMGLHGRGFVAVAVTPGRARKLGLEWLPARNQRPRAHADRALPMVSIEARHGVSTGISASDRAKTITTVAAPASVPSDLVSPGHVSH